MSCLNLNRVILAGHITADPELRQTQSGISVTSFSIAVNREYAKDQEQQKPDFIDIIAWRQNAEFITRYFKKGSAICVIGSLQKGLGQISKIRSVTLPRLLWIKLCS